jgi:predicted alpha/beta hydrolase
MAQYEARPDVIDEPGPTRLLTAMSPATMSAAPSAPVYMYTTLDDEFAPLSAALKLAARYCAAGVRVQQVTDPPSDHIAESVVGAPAAVNYLADRFAGKPAPSTC